MTSPTLSRTTFYYIFGGLVLAAALFYGVTKYQLWNAQESAIVESQKTITQLRGAYQSEKEAFVGFAEEQADKQLQLAKNIASILPPDENYTDLTRTFDDFFAAHDSAKNPLLQTSLRFGKGQPLAENPQISELPISMNVQGTRSNFFAFLDFITNSGDLNSKQRLMAIRSIQLNFPDGEELIDEEQQVINFTVDMVSYYQTPKVKR